MPIAFIIIACLAVVVLVVVVVVFSLYISYLVKVTLPVPAGALNITRYMGKWFEIARIPSWFENQCTSSAVAIYTLNNNQTFSVVNQCDTKNGISSAQGTGRPDGKLYTFNGDLWVSPATLQVSFFLPFQGSYWVLDIDEAYSYALVGSPDRKYLWILSRSPTLDATIITQLVEKARQMHYPVQNLSVKSVPV